MIKRIKYILSILLLSAAYQGYGQSEINSPYSLSAVGELSFGGFAQHASMGGVSRSSNYETTFSPLNPASYSSLRYTVLEVGADARTGTIATENTSLSSNSSNLNYFALGFPIYSKLGIGFSAGIYQFSNVGYNVLSDFRSDTPAYYNRFRGTGGLSKFYLGLSFSPIKNFAIGANYHNNFGVISSFRTQVFTGTNNLFSFNEEQSTNYRGSGWDYGVQYKGQVKGINNTLGLTYQTESDLKGSGVHFVQTFYGAELERSGLFFPIDTILFNSDTISRTRLPSTLGLSYTIEKNNKWGIGIEYEQANWSSVVNSLNGQNFFDNVTYSIGGYIIPDVNASRAQFYKAVKYSAGFRYQNMYYNFFNQQIDEVGITFGLGLPIKRAKRIEDKTYTYISRVNLAFDFSRRGTTENDLVEENYFAVKLGFNLADKWFVKRKYH